MSLGSIFYLLILVYQKLLCSGRLQKATDFGRVCHTQGGIYDFCYYRYYCCFSALDYCYL